jgi:hypothetical protein
MKIAKKIVDFFGAFLRRFCGLTLHVPGGTSNLC